MKLGTFSSWVDSVEGYIFGIYRKNAGMYGNKIPELIGMIEGAIEMPNKDIVIEVSPIDNVTGEKSKVIRYFNMNDIEISRLIEKEERRDGRKES